MSGEGWLPLVPDEEEEAEEERNYKKLYLSSQGE
jgi:hypothetical protein